MSILFHDPAPWKLGGTPTRPVITCASGRVTKDIVRMDDSKEAAFYQRGNAKLLQAAPEMHALLNRLEDNVYALDGTTRDNEALVDDYKKLMARLPRSA